MTTSPLENLESSDALRRASYLPLALVACLGVFLSLAAYFVMRQAENRKLVSDLRLLARDYVAGRVVAGRPRAPDLQ